MITKTTVVGLGVLLFAFAGASAYGKSIDIAVERLPKHMEDAQVSASFQYNQKDPELNRAWVDLTVSQPSPAGDAPGESVTIREHVPGLRYSPESHQITYTAEGEGPVVCANVVETRFLFFHSTELKTTGDCVLSVDKLPEAKGETPGPASVSAPEAKQDDGFYVRHYAVVKILLGTHG